LLAIFLTPLVDKLEAKKMPRFAAALFVLILFAGFFTAVFLHISKTFLPSLAHFASDMPNIIQDFSHSLDLPENVLSELNDSMKSFTSLSLSALQSSINVVFSLFTKMLDLLIVIFVTFYLLKDGAVIKAYLIGLFPDKDYRRVAVLFNSVIASLSHYIRGQLIICLITGICVFLYFSFFDLPYASIFAVLSAGGEFIPVVGPTIASCFGVTMALTISVPAALQAGIFYLCLTQINHNIVYPYLIGKTLNLHPIAIVLAVMLGGQLLGAAGMFLAVPCSVILKLVIADIARHK
jgi:predicted PurR-regulated permease PerM